MTKPKSGSNIDFLFLKSKIYKKKRFFFCNETSRKPLSLLRDPFFRLTVNLNQFLNEFRVIIKITINFSDIKHLIYLID